MKKTLTSMALLLSFGSPVLSDEITWVPIMMGDITFFVPLGESSAPPPSVPPVSPIVDGNLQSCINETMAYNGWQTYDQITELYCVGRGIHNISGIESLVNLTRLAIGQNYISDISPLYGMYSLTWLHLASFQFTNSIYNADIVGLGNLNLTFLGVPSYSYADGTELNVSAFPNGFNSLEELNINVQDDYIDCDTVDLIRQRLGTGVQVLYFSPFDNPDNPDLSCRNN